MESIDSPSPKLITDKDEAMTSCHTSHEKYSWLLEMSQNISENIIGDQFETATSQTPQNFRDGLWVCPNCNKTYRQKGWLDRHLSSVHNIRAESDRPMESDDTNSIARSFMKVALLIRDTDRAYRTGDGGRLIRNAKLQLLLSHVTKHYKYRLWMWRQLAYSKAILSQRQSMEYIWNVTVNLSGGLGRNIANDNLVELQVDSIKKKLKAQGSNVSYNSARKAALSMQMQDELICTVAPAKSGKHTKAKTVEDLKVIVAELLTARVFDKEGRTVKSFENYKDPYQKVDYPKLNVFINKQKKSATQEMYIK